MADGEEARGPRRRDGSRRLVPPTQDVTLLRALRAARDRIDAEFADRLDVDALARSIGYSRAHFIRAFRGAYGESPGAYRTRRRIERATDLLRTTDLSVTAICFAVGFSSLGAFSSRFAAITGRPPTEYRRAALSGPGVAAIPACYALMWRAGLAAAVERAHGALLEKPAEGQAPTVDGRHRPARQAVRRGQSS